jgi:multidrug transporter EmrE-like cation transporter
MKNGYEPLMYGSYMATIDVFMLSIIKAISQGILSKSTMLLPSAVYAMQPWLFLTSLKYESMTVMNLMWDVLSDIFVTLTGIFYFKEKVSSIKLIGVFLAILSVVLLNCEDMCKRYLAKLGFCFDE